MMNNKFVSICVLTLGIALVAQQGSAASKIPDGTQHDLSKAMVMDRTILAVMEDYYDSSRIVPLTMFKGAMAEVVKAVAEVKVTYEAEKSAVVEVPGHRMSLSLDSVKSPWGLSKAFHRIFAFLKDYLPANENLNYRNIEYAAVNGLLATLDPHTSAMTPEEWEELRMSTRGAFEGIGIRITTDYRTPCNGDLTVVEVFEGTPAQKAGLKVGDKIVRIENDSTVNITTSEAADQLRGEPGTSVKVGILRGDGVRKTLNITRQRIPIDSVKWEMLEGNVGFIELSAFQQGSADEMQNALEKLHEKNMKGLVLDLRSNPGGLLEAAIDIADLFIANGTLVTTAGRNKEDRDVTNAKVEDTEPAYPIAILIDGYTASAAEILSGALRNHGRALLIGETTFGKGSVQNIITLPDDGAMRLTIQQYLIPGDISIQAVGVAPDVSFVPSVVDREEMLVSARERTFSEASLDSHLIRASSIERGDRPGALRMPYFVSAEQRRDDVNRFNQCYSDDEDRKSSRARYEAEFARQLISETKGVTTAELLVTAREMVAKLGAKEQENVQSALRKLGVDWSPGAGEAAYVEEMIPDDGFVTSVKLDNAAKAGSDFRFTVSVANRGKTAVHQLRAKTTSDNPYLNGIDLVFGKLAPGKSKKWTATVKLPPVLNARIDPVEISFFSMEGRVPNPLQTTVAQQGRKLPELVYEWNLVDGGNGNGYIEPGESLTMHMRVINRGEGPSFKSEANLSSKPGLDIESGRFVLKPLKPGESAEGQFEITASPEPVTGTREVELTLSVDEWIQMKMPSLIPLQEQKIVLTVHSKVPAIEPASGTVMVSEAQAPVYDVASVLGRVTAMAPQGAGFATDFTSGEFFHIRAADGQSGWVLRTAVAPGGNTKGKLIPAVTQLPEITLDGEEAVLTKGDHFTLSGKVSHPNGLRDVIVFSNGKKEVFEHVADAAVEAPLAKVVPLEVGVNAITVIARHDNHTVNSKTIFVRRSE